MTFEGEKALWTLHGVADGPDTLESFLGDEWEGAALAQLKQARELAENAYAPYSSFRVGASAATDQGVYCGCNVENASYGLTICAERAAISAAISAGARQLKILALSTIDSLDQTDLSSRSPCGACRQVISEFASPATLVVIDGGNEKKENGKKTGRYRADLVSIEALLPWRFQV